MRYFGTSRKYTKALIFYQNGPEAVIGRVPDQALSEAECPFAGLPLPQSLARTQDLKLRIFNLAGYGGSCQFKWVISRRINPDSAGGQGLVSRLSRYSDDPLVPPATRA